MIKDLETTYVLFYNSKVYHITNPLRRYRIYPYTHCGLRTDMHMIESKTPLDNYPVCSKCQAKVSLKSGKS